MCVPHGVRFHWGTAIRPTRWWVLLPRSHSSQTKIHRIEMDRMSGSIHHGQWGTQNASLVSEVKT